MNKILTSLLVAAFAVCGCDVAPSTSVVWTEGETGEDGKAVHELTIVNPPKEAGWSLWFCSFKTSYEAVDSAADFKFYGGSLYQIVPKSQDSDPVVISYRSRPIKRLDWAPQGIYLMTADGKTFDLPVTYNYLPAEKFNTFKYNSVKTEVWDMIPALKSVEASEGETKVGEWSANIVDGQKPGWYRITLDGNVHVDAADEDGAWYAKVTLENMKRNAGSDTLPDCTIEDWPDMQYRGMMLDVCRNFTTKDNVLKLIDILSHYKVNKFHFHVGDDEGWRVEIDGLPELTSYGAHRGAPALAQDGSMIEKNGLMPSYTGHCDPKDMNLPGNGYYTKDDFIEILKYANERHIHVIPEFDTPGHSRAAIKSMDKRYATTGDDTYLLSEAEDTSVYESAQNYSDNALNVALPSTYAFIAKVFDGIISMYKEAGVPLDAIHFGGDEVPDGAWEGSPACRKLMAENGWEDTAMLKDYFVSKVMDIAQERGVKIAGWQDLTLHLSDATFDRLKEMMYSANLWSTVGSRIELPYKLANQGLNIVLSNCGNTYFDLAYNTSKAEPGHSWAGFVDERRSFSLLPFDLYKSIRWNDEAEMVDISSASDGKVALENPDKVIGVQGQLWCETVKNFDYVTYYLFPKALGVFERGWNAHPLWEATTTSDDPLFLSDFDRFYSIIQEREVPWYQTLGISYREY